MLVSAIQHCETAISIQISLTSWALLPLLLGCHKARVWAPCLRSSFPLTICFIHGYVYVSMLLSQFVSPSPSLAVSTDPFSMSASLFLPCKQFQQYHFSRLHIYLWSFPGGAESESESEVAQLCLILCDPMDYSLPGSSVHGIFQARILEWVAISFSRGSLWPRDQTWVSCFVGRHYRLSHQGSLGCSFIITPDQNLCSAK